MANPSHTSLQHSWQGSDDPGRLDTATINLETNRLTAHGTSRTADYAVSWALATASGWVTQRLTVTVHGQGWSRHLELMRSDDGVWSSETLSAGDTDLPEPGISDPEGLAGALDCDLGLCPVTNTMPILRLNLVSGDGAPVGETELTMARVEVPSLRVVPSTPVYSHVRAARSDSPALMLYNSGNGGFAAELTIDQDGVVLDYPGLARRIS
ncbi:putative glycolipid-binding domain-containing protein [Arthrobacter sp. HLT1-21]